MQVHQRTADKRTPLTRTIDTELCVVGGGMAGVCAAVTAARQGVSVVLIHDRPVLGGNASSEVRLWVLGASAHNQNNNRWAREGGIVEEILVENMYRNSEGNALLFDTLLLEKVVQEQNITLLLNTVAVDIDKHDNIIDCVHAYCSIAETRYIVNGKIFIDSSGDGLIGYLAGVPFRIGAESPEEFDERFAPDPKVYGELLGHSIFFITKDTGRHVSFSSPSFALKDAHKKIPRFKNFNVHDQGCMFWWIEYGGRLDTIHDSEEIKWELWKIIYGVWDYIKNSGEYPEADTLTLEWVGLIPGKRESRRFHTARWLVQNDIVNQVQHEDAVSFGGWSIDLHPSDGIYSARPGCDQYHAKGVYEIPFSTMYNPDFPNIFFAGRIIGASHVAFGSTRVMATCAHSAQAVGMAAALSLETSLPAARFSHTEIEELQRRLQRMGQHIPRYPLQETANLAQVASITTSSTMNIFDLPVDGEMELKQDIMQMLPLEAGRLPVIIVPIIADVPTALHIELRVSKDKWNYTPEEMLQTWNIAIEKSGSRNLRLQSSVVLSEDTYVYVRFKANTHVRLLSSALRVSGVFSLLHTDDQVPPLQSGIHGFEIWTPPRRPEGHVIVLRSEQVCTKPFDAYQAVNGYQRPGYWPNAWVAAPGDTNPHLRCIWDIPQVIKRIELVFDTDVNHPMESVNRGHPESIMPVCVRSYSIHDKEGTELWSEHNNYHSLRTICFASSITTNQLCINIHAMNGNAAAAIFSVRVYAD